MLHEAIMKTGRPIVLSLSPGPALIDKAWHYEKYANMWRITDDFWDNWKLLLNMFERCELWQNHVSEGCFPDCDMLPLGWLGQGFHADKHTWHTNFTKEEQRTMMTLWCIFRSPLMLGTEMTRLDEWTLSLLTNADVLGLIHHSAAQNSSRATKSMRYGSRTIPWKTRIISLSSTCPTRRLSSAPTSPTKGFRALFPHESSGTAKSLYGKTTAQHSPHRRRSPHTEQNCLN